MTAIRATPSVPPTNGRVRRIFLVAASSGEGLLTDRRTAAQPWRQEPLFVPQSGLACAQRSNAVTRHFVLRDAERSMGGIDAMRVFVSTLDEGSLAGRAASSDGRPP